ncbi:MAG: translation initiation factor IF-1 [Malacoplasma sp.]|nr:translation initiation factor IF-1 [Malacoplasma sp.]MDE5767223.1 translation initiation factor IF-1 [Malacoplasma sp.]MDE5774823.1 translation initiation factor IF-1 [Malacoplasma sp.]MDE5842055.1 translation initiation factor IF-1 [Malacoplasma sp.]MDE5949674.1 translation initiation factor IF-1 [Malacoplasma sp.]
MSKEGKITLKGKVTTALQGGQFKVLLENNVEITANVSGKIRVYKIQILKGDTVEVELSPYDLTRGRIIYRIS